MIYGYARVSTKRQLAGNSIEEQHRTLLEQGCTNIIEEQCTGKTTDRPKLCALMGQLKKGDTLVVTKLDRLARNVVEGVTLIRELLYSGVKVHVLNVGLLDDTPMGNFFITTLLAVAELERSMIVERTQSGKEVAKSKPGYREGRPRIAKSRLEAALKMVDEGNSYKKVAELMDIGEATLYRARARQRADAITAVLPH